MEKFEGQPGFEKVLDGPVRVYDVRALRDVPAPFADREPPGLPGTWTPWQVAVTGAAAADRAGAARPPPGPTQVPGRRLLAGRAPAPRGDGARRPRGAERVCTGRGRGDGGGRSCSCWCGTRGSPPRSPCPPAGSAAWGWGLLIGFVATASLALAIWSTWQGLLDVPPLPPPLSGPPTRHSRGWSRVLTRTGPRSGRIERGIWAPFQSLLGAQVIAAGFGLVFWVIVARLVDQHDLGVAAAAISAQTLLGMTCALGLGTMLIAELPLHPAQRQRKLVLRSLLVTGVFATVVGAADGRGRPLAARQPPRGARRPGRRGGLRARHRRGRLVLRARRVLSGPAPVPGPGGPEPARRGAAVPDDRSAPGRRVHRLARPPAVLGGAVARLGASRAVAAAAAARRPHQPAAADRRGGVRRTRRCATTA